MPLSRYLNRSFLLCVVLGFTSGLPLFVLINLVQAWLATEHVDIKQIGLFSLMLMPYAWKFVWAPLLDRYSLPGFGRRRGWMLAMSVLVLACIAAMGFLDPGGDIRPVMAAALVLSFASASLDIAIDAYRREILKPEEQGLGNAIHVNAYKVAGLVPGALSLIMADHLPWDAVFGITALFMAPGIVMAMFVSEPEVYGTPPRDLRAAIVEPFSQFVNARGWKGALLVLAFVFFYKVGDSMAVSLATKFYLDLGFTKTQVGALGKTIGFWSSIGGGFVGGVWMITLGVSRSLWVFGALQWLAILPFAALAKVGANKALLGFTIGFEAFAVGMGTAAIVSFIAEQCDRRYTATQFALFTSLAALPRTVLNAGTGYIVDAVGWFAFFWVCFAMAVPGMAMLPKVAPWREGSRST